MTESAPETEVKTQPKTYLIREIPEGLKEGLKLPKGATLQIAKPGSEKRASFYGGPGVEINSDTLRELMKTAGCQLRVSTGRNIPKEETGKARFSDGQELPDKPSPALPIEEALDLFKQALEQEKTAAQPPATTTSTEATQTMLTEGKVESVFQARGEPPEEQALTPQEKVQQAQEKRDKTWEMRLKTWKDYGVELNKYDPYTGPAKSAIEAYNACKKAFRESGFKTEDEFMASVKGKELWGVHNKFATLREDAEIVFRSTLGKDLYEKYSVTVKPADDADEALKIAKAELAVAQAATNAAAKPLEPASKKTGEGKKEPTLEEQIEEEFERIRKEYTSHPDRVSYMNNWLKDRDITPGTPEADRASTVLSRREAEYKIREREIAKEWQKRQEAGEKVGTIDEFKREKGFYEWSAKHDQDWGIWLRNKGWLTETPGEKQKQEAAVQPPGLTPEEAAAKSIGQGEMLLDAAVNASAVDDRQRLYSQFQTLSTTIIDQLQKISPSEARKLSERMRIKQEWYRQKIKEGKPEVDENQPGTEVLESKTEVVIDKNQPEVRGLKSLGRLGGGAFSTVYLYENESTHEKIVMKLVPTSDENPGVNIDTAKEHLNDERKTLTNLHKQGLGQRLVELKGEITAGGRSGLRLEALIPETGWLQLNQAVKQMKPGQALSTCAELVNLYQDLEEGKALAMFEMRSDHIFVNLSGRPTIKGIDFGQDAGFPELLRRQRQLATIIAFVLSKGTKYGLPGDVLKDDDAAMIEEMLSPGHRGLLTKIINGDITGAAAMLKNLLPRKQ